MAQGQEYDENGYLIEDPAEAQRRAEESSQGYSGPPPPTTPAPKKTFSDAVMKDWVATGGNTTQQMKDFFGNYEGVQFIGDDKIQVNGRTYDTIHNVGTADAKARTGYTTDSRYASGSKGSSSGNASVTQQWTAAPAPRAPARDPRVDELYNMLMGRAQQGLDVSREDPAIRAQSDAYSANEERAMRNYLADMAEGAGANANLRGEQRMASEKFGQRTGAFEAELMGREITARRDEIQQALVQMQGMLTTEQEMNLRRELAQLQDATQRLGISTSAETSRRAQDLGWDSEMLRNDQFMRQLGFNQSNSDRDYDARMRGL